MPHVPSPPLGLLARPFTQGGLLRRTAVWTLTGATVTAAFLGLATFVLTSATDALSGEGLTSDPGGGESTVSSEDEREARADLPE